MRNNLKRKIPSLYTLSCRLNLKNNSLLVLGSLGSLGSNYLALSLVVFLPVESLAVYGTVPATLARGAAFVGHRGSLRGLAPTAKLKLGRCTHLVQNILGLVLHLALALEPVKGSVMAPGVDEFNVRASALLVGKLLGAVLVLHVVHAQLAELFEAICHVLLDELLSDLSQLALFSLVLV